MCSVGGGGTSSAFARSDAGKRMASAVAKDRAAQRAPGGGSKGQATHTSIAKFKAAAKAAGHRVIKVSTRKDGSSSHQAIRKSDGRIVGHFQTGKGGKGGSGKLNK
jgi:hypothetical protein